MNLKIQSLRTTRWGAVATGAATAAATAVALCAPATQAVVVGAGVSAGSGAGVAARTSGWSIDRWGDAAADTASSVGGIHKADIDPGSMYTVGTAIGARLAWNKKDVTGRFLTGQGVGVAVLDSGVSQVAGLDGAGKVTYGPDLSVEGNGVQTHQDTFGHGTFMAGIIAGRGTTVATPLLNTASPDVQLGVAPDAKLLAMKLANTDGSTDVSQVIAALDWVTQNPVMPDGTRVRVINLSYGTDSAQGYLTDPLAAAAENAWKRGIVVVVSAGNDGSATGRLTNPAIDPYVIAVGATDNNHSLAGWDPLQTAVASYSQVGSTTRHADLVAPGTSLVSNRAPGSFIDVNNPVGLVAGDTSGRLFRGSGTSQAAAVVSGTVALLLQAYPTLTPDQVKYTLTSAARPIPNASSTTAGAGALDLTMALDQAQKMTGKTITGTALRTAAVQAFPKATGLGSIDAARGGSGLIDAAGVDLTGEIDAQGNLWKPAVWMTASSSLKAWSGGNWLGVTWTGATWQPPASGLTASRWSASRWSASRWSTANWASTTWTASRWSASRWSASRWSAARWSDSFWS